MRVFKFIDEWEYNIILLYNLRRTGISFNIRRDHIETL